MFPRERRLRRRRDIERLFKDGRRVSTPALVLRVAPNKLTKPRVTVVVGTVVNKRAVVRNRLKRQLRHILMDEFKNKNTGADVMLTARPSALTMALPERRAAVHDLLRRARLI